MYNLKNHQSIVIKEADKGSTVVIWDKNRKQLYYLYYPIVNLNFSCNNNLYIHLLFHFTYDTDEQIIDFEIHLSLISNNTILMLYTKFSSFID